MLSPFFLLQQGRRHSSQSTTFFRLPSQGPYAMGDLPLTVTSARIIPLAFKHVHAFLIFLTHKESCSYLLSSQPHILPVSYNLLVVNSKRDYECLFWSFLSVCTLTTLEILFLVICEPATYRFNLLHFPQSSNYVIMLLFIALINHSALFFSSVAFTQL